MSQEKIKNIIEAALMVSTRPLNIPQLLSLFESDLTLEPERNDIRAAVEELQQDYQGRGVALAEIASGFRFQARDEYAQWVNHLFDERPPRYSRALLETLSIIAYRQPITRGEIEEIRGVSVSGTIVKTLFEREWIKGVGHRDVPGKPELLVTTKAFLDYFNLKKLSDLPALADITDFDSINPDLFEALEEEAKSNAEQSEPGADNTLAESVNDTGETTDGDTDTEVEVEAGVVAETETDVNTEVEVNDEIAPVDEAAVESITPEPEALQSSEEDVSEEEGPEEESNDEGAKVIPFSA